MYIIVKIVKLCPQERQVARDAQWARGEEAGEDDQHEHEELVILLTLLHLALSLRDRGSTGEL